MFPGMTVEELSLATASAIKVLAETLIALGADPASIEDRAEEKAQDLMLNQRQSNAANMLRAMLGEQIPD